jgi:type I restriction enzyme S subunit
MRTSLKSGYKQTDVGVIPEEWEVLPLNQITDPKRPIGYGIVQTGRSVTNGVKCVRVVDIEDGRVNGDALITTSHEISISYKRTLLAEGDLVIALRGKIGALAVIEKDLIGANLTRGVALLAPLDGFDSTYLCHYLSSPTARQVFERNLNGSALQEIPIATLRKIPAIIPPLPEQRAIAEALGDVDAMLGTLTQLIAKKRDLKQAAMQQLLTGKKRLPAFSGDWEESTLGDKVVKVGSGITPTGGATVYQQSGRPFLRSQNVGWGTLLLDDIAFIDDQTHEAFASTEIQVGDVFLNITGASIGRSAIADDRVKGGNVNQHVCIIRPNVDALDVGYLNYFLLSTTGQRQIDSFQAGGNRQGLNFGQIRSFRLYSPKLLEQKAIAAVLSDMDAELAALEQRLDKTRALKQGMMQELLTGRTRLV